MSLRSLEWGLKEEMTREDLGHVGSAQEGWPDTVRKVAATATHGRKMGTLLKAWTMKCKDMGRSCRFRGQRKANLVPNGMKMSWKKVGSWLERQGLWFYNLFLTSQVPSLHPQQDNKTLGWLGTVASICESPGAWCTVGTQ